jgi:hypothetical protein
MVCLNDPQRAQIVGRDGRPFHPVFEAKTLDRACPPALAAIGSGGWTETGELRAVNLDFDVGHGHDAQKYDSVEDATAAALEVREFVGGAMEVRRSKSGTGIHGRVRIAKGAVPADGRSIARHIAWWLKKNTGIRTDHSVLGRQNLWFWADTVGPGGFELIEPSEGAWLPPDEALQPPPVILPPPLPPRRVGYSYKGAAEPTPHDCAARYLRKIPGAVAGSGGHDHTFKVACLLVHGFGLSDSDAWPLLATWNHQCQPPWSERELRHKLEDALRTQDRQHPRGYKYADSIERWRQHQDSQRTSRVYCLKG